MGLSEKEIEEFKKKLLALRQQHRAAFEGTACDVKKADDARGGSQHHADEGTDDFGRTISIEVTARELDVIKQIDRALEKIEEGTYGLCDMSGDPIPMKRLEAIPYATMTRDAQERLEQEKLL
jgi:DnaK suppressor protein